MGEALPNETISNPPRSAAPERIPAVPDAALEPQRVEHREPPATPLPRNVHERPVEPGGSRSHEREVGQEGLSRQKGQPRLQTPAERHAAERGIVTRPPPQPAKEPELAKKVISRTAGALLGGVAGVYLATVARSAMLLVEKFGGTFLEASWSLFTTGTWSAFVPSALKTLTATFLGPAGLAVGAVAGYFAARKLFARRKNK